MKLKERRVILVLLAAVVALGWVRFFQARSQTARLEVIAKEGWNVRK